jgi:homocysteine S-methyltransferase
MENLMILSDNIRDELKKHKLVADGAFGTYYMTLYREEPEKMDIPEKANITAPDRVVNIHRRYIEAGADFIRTNTFASNIVSLNTDREGVKKNIEAAVRLVREAADITSCGSDDDVADENQKNSIELQKTQKNVYIAGDIGPIPVSGGLSRQKMIEEYIFAGECFQDMEVDIILFETFPELEILEPVIQHLKERKPCTIMVHFSVNQFGYSSAGLSARKLIGDAVKNPMVDGTGLNCGVGPAHMEKLVKQLDIPEGTFISVLPNSGYPKLVQNRLTFTDNVEYFTEKMKDISACGVDILGGCCGTTPDYIRHIREQVSLTPADKKSCQEKKQENIREAVADNFLRRRQEDSNHKLIAVELAPPVNANDEKLLDAAHILQNVEVDVVTFPDSPSGRTRADSVLMAEKVRRETGLRVMPHICCRDKNAIAIRSTILGAKLNDIKDFLLLTGDPVPVLFRQTTKSVFNFDSIGMMNIVDGMNEEEFKDAPVTYGGAINHNRVNIDIEIDRVKRKMAAGASFFMTQPVFSYEQAQVVKKIKEETGAVILVGVMPLVSRRNAEFMKNEMTGIVIPDDIINRYDINMTREEGECCGIDIAREILSITDDFADGYYFSFPFNRVHMLQGILE